jgi:hypothetical protein
MKETTRQIADLLEAGQVVNLYLVQNAWIQGGGEVEVGHLDVPDLVINPSYFERFAVAAATDPENVNYDEMEKDLEMLAKMMRGAYSRLMGGRLQLFLT